MMHLLKWHGFCAHVLAAAVETSYNLSWLTDKITLPSADCSIEYQKEPLILCCSLVCHATGLLFLTRPIHLHPNLRSTLCCRYTWTENEPWSYTIIIFSPLTCHFFNHTRRKCFFFFLLKSFFFFFFVKTFDRSSWWKVTLQKSCRRHWKVLRGGKSRHCQDCSVSAFVCVSVFHLCLDWAWGS